MDAGHLRSEGRILLSSKHTAIKIRTQWKPTSEHVAYVYVQAKRQLWISFLWSQTHWDLLIQGLRQA